MTPAAKHALQRAATYHGNLMRAATEAADRHVARASNANTSASKRSFYDAQGRAQREVADFHRAIVDAVVEVLAPTSVEFRATADRVCAHYTPRLRPHDGNVLCANCGHDEDQHARGPFITRRG